VKRILAGTPLEQAVSRDALRNPDSLEPFLDRGTPTGV
jgi:acetoacetyl-CoA synthetase